LALGTFPPLLPAEESRGETYLPFFFFPRSRERRLDLPLPSSSPFPRGSILLFPFYRSRGRATVLSSSPPPLPPKKVVSDAPPPFPPRSTIFFSPPLPDHGMTQLRRVPPPPFPPHSRDRLVDVFLPSKISPILFSLSSPSPI